MLGIERYPGPDTVNKLLKSFTQPDIEAVLASTLMQPGLCQPQGWSLDRDSTMPNHSSQP